MDNDALIMDKVDYTALVDAAWSKHRYQQGTRACVAFKHGAEWQAAQPVAQQGEPVDGRFSEHLLSMIKNISDALGISDDEQACANGDLEILAAIEELKASLPVAQQAQAVIDEMVSEFHRAKAKFPTWPTDPLHALAILGEEFGELTKDMLQLTYEPNKTNQGNVRKEAFQTAAMVLRLALSLDRYVYKPCDQHSQDEASAAS